MLNENLAFFPIFGGVLRTAAKNRKKCLMKTGVRRFLAQGYDAPGHTRTPRAVAVSAKRLSGWGPGGREPPPVRTFFKTAIGSLGYHLGVHPGRPKRVQNTSGTSPKHIQHTDETRPVHVQDTFKASP